MRYIVVISSLILIFVPLRRNFCLLIVVVSSMLAKTLFHQVEFLFLDRYDFFLGLLIFHSTIDKKLIFPSFPNFCSHFRQGLFHCFQLRFNFLLHFIQFFILLISMICSASPTLCSIFFFRLCMLFAWSTTFLFHRA
jgi:hypothetical protein